MINNMVSITRRDIVDRAFKILSLPGFELDDAPGDEQDMSQALDDMMAELQSPDRNFGYLIAEDVVDRYSGDMAGIKRDAISDISRYLRLGRILTTIIMAVVIKQGGIDC